MHPMDSDANAFVGDFVQTPFVRGRVYAVHHRCPEGAAWRSMQDADLTPQEKDGEGRWVSVLVHDGGSVVVPDRLVSVIPPVPMTNLWTTFYFRPEAA